MSRIWATGFELQSATNGVEVRTLTGDGIETTVVRSGAASYRCGVSVPTVTFSGFEHSVFGQNTMYYRVYFYISALDNNSSVYFAGEIRSSTSVPIISARIGNNSGTYQLTTVINNGGTTLGPVNLSDITAGWHMMEIKCDALAQLLDPVNGFGDAEVRIDGATYAYQSIKFTITAPTRVAAGIYNGTGGTITGSTAYIDDIAANNTNGSSNNNWCGPGKIVHFRPTGAGDETLFVAGAGSGANWERVDEITPNDATDYVEKTTNTLQRDAYTTETPASKGMTANDKVKWVTVGIRGGSNSTSGSPVLAPQIRSAAGATRDGSTGQSYAVNGFFTNDSATNPNYINSWSVDPTTGVAWTVTGTNSLTNMQIICNAGTATTTTRRLSTIWALVDYVPASNDDDGFFPYF